VEDDNDTYIGVCANDRTDSVEWIGMLDGGGVGRVWRKGAVVERVNGTDGGEG